MFSSWSEDYYTPVAEIDANHILKSTLTGESRQQKGDSRACFFCGFRYLFRTIHDRYHLGLGSVSKKVQKCKPSMEHIELHAEVVKEVKRRDDHDKIQAREMDQRSLESGQPDESSTYKSLGKGLGRLMMISHVHSSDSESESESEQDFDYFFV